MAMLRNIRIDNLLSFGPIATPIELGALNVLIGPNGSGKSNFLEVIHLLRSLPVSLEKAIRSAGGITNLIRHGSRELEGGVSVEIEMDHGISIDHTFGIWNASPSYELSAEIITRIAKDKARQLIFEYSRSTSPTLFYDGEPRPLRGSNRASVLYWYKDPVQQPDLGRLADFYQEIALYREWTFGGKAIFRQPQPADLRNDRLEEDFSNLGMFLNQLRKDPATKRKLIQALKDLYQGLSDFEVIVEGGTVQVFFTEGAFSIPATRLSDGSLRYLCLLAILLDPDPPALIGIEEPELGLHPDLIPKIADLLVDASSRTQLIVTTHSEILVDALSDTPDAILVCEKVQGVATQLQRLSSERLAEWLKKYRLGELWSMGEIGGNRW